MAVVSVKKCSKYNQILCEEEKKIVIDFQTEYLKKFGERINMNDAICEIIILYGELTKK